MSASSKKKLRKEQNAVQLTEKQLKAKKEAKKLNIYTTIFVVAIIAVVIAGIVIAGVSYYKSAGIKEKNTIAATVNDHEISSAELTYYYIDVINNNYNTWSSTYNESLSLYLGLMGLDITVPLGEQQYTPELTWAEHFINLAVDSAKSDYLLCDQAIAEGFTMSEEDQAALDSALTQLPMFASIYGFPNTDSYLKSVYGNGADEESYAAYKERNAIAAAYYNAYTENLEISDTDIREHEAEMFDDYSSFSYATYRVDYNNYLPELEGEDAEHTDADKDAARAAAKADAELLKDFTTVDELNAAIAALAVNSGKDVTCTEYTDSLFSSTSSVAREWLADESRKIGDSVVIPKETQVVDSEGNNVTVVNDYYAVLFLGRNDNEMNLANVRHILVKFQDGTTDESGNVTYSNASKAVALASAEEILNTFLSGSATEDSFIELVKEASDDTASIHTGGLYEDITPEQGIYEPAFTDWSADPSRKAGDTGIIETSYGYHVMYFVGHSDITYRDHMITEDIRAASVNEWYDGILNAGTATKLDTSLMDTQIVLGS